MSIPRRTSQSYERLFLALTDEADKIVSKYESPFWLGAAYAYKNAAELCKNQDFFASLWDEYVKEI